MKDKGRKSLKIHTGTASVGEGHDKSVIIEIAALFLCVLSAAVMYATHRAVPFMMDDLWYSTMLSSDEPIRNLSDIVKSQIWHYHNWGGRSIAHGILQITLLLGQNAADILNVFVTFLLSWLICAVAGINKDGRLFGVWAAVSMLLGLNANWKMSMFWQAGAANYLYITVFILLYLYFFLEPEIHFKGLAVLMLPLGLIAGWSNENMGPAVFIVSLVVIGDRLKNEQKIPLWMYVGSISCMFGCMLIILAPGNFMRSSEVAENSYGFLWRCFLRGYAESRAVCEYLFPSLLILLFVVMISRFIFGIRLEKKNALLLLGALLSWGAMLLSPHYPDRASFGTMVLIICVIISCVREIIARKKELLTPMFFGCALVWLRGMYFLGEFLAISWGWIK